MDGPAGAGHPTQSFILRVWVEEPARPGRAATWRGHVTDVQSREYRAVDSFADVHRFLVARLSEVGIRPRMLDRIRLVLVRERRS